MIRTSIDRPDIFYELREFEPKSFEDLRFLLPEKLTLEEARKLPKAIIYFKDSKSIALREDQCRVGDW
jgi:superfamily II DNA helicase RecQ